jgi:hypothetical protein
MYVGRSCTYLHFQYLFTYNSSTYLLTIYKSMYLQPTILSLVAYSPLGM